MVAWPLPETEELPILGSHIVVLLDDEAPTLAALGRALRGEPYEAWTAQDPAQVLEWIESQDISLVVSDQRMPEMEGTELLDEVRLRSPLTRGVILTAHPESIRMSRVLRGWVRSIILKPWNDDRLRGTLRYLLSGIEIHRPRPPEETGGFEPDLGGES